MDEDFLREVAAQLRKPNGNLGLEVAIKMNESNLQMNLKTIELLDIRDNEAVLEIGMSNGAFVDHILKKANDIHYLGIDYSSDMVELAKKNNEQLIDSGSAEFKFGDIQNLPLPSNSIDKLFTVNTIYFWENVDLALQECRRVLKTDGLFAIGIRPKNCIQKYPSTQFNFRYFEIMELEGLFVTHGFDVQKSIHEFETETEVLGQLIVPEFVVIVGKKS